MPKPLKSAKSKAASTRKALRELTRLTEAFGGYAAERRSMADQGKLRAKFAAEHHYKEGLESLNEAWKRMKRANSFGKTAGLGIEKRAYHAMKSVGDLLMELERQRIVELGFEPDF